MEFLFSIFLLLGIGAAPILLAIIIPGIVALINLPKEKKQAERMTDEYRSKYIEEKRQNALLQRKVQTISDAEKAIEEYQNLRADLIEKFNLQMAEVEKDQKQRDEILDLRLARIDEEVEEKIAQQKRSLEYAIRSKVEVEVRQKKKELAELEDNIKKSKKSLNEVKKERLEILKSLDEELEHIIKEKCGAYPYLAGIIADFATINYENAAKRLEKKRRPAKVEAQRIKELAKETRKIIVESKVVEYKLAYIEKLFPNINDIFDSGFSEENFVLETEETTDRVRLFLSDDEYKKTTSAERNQLALDRYVQSRKTRWQIGRDYEMYIGYCIEQRGISVKYTGIIEKLEDMGRDLIATKGKSVCIVQCKNWAQEKTIHEKHIFQLYGTMILYKIEHHDFSVDGAFVTSTNLSETARMVAKELGIQVFENITLKEFPRIKCNINQTTKEKIYHLPFDQQYDTAVIQKKHGEFYAFTTKEAEEKGFRRAWKYFSS